MKHDIMTSKCWIQDGLQTGIEKCIHVYMPQVLDASTKTSRHEDRASRSVERVTSMPDREHAQPMQESTQYLRLPLPTLSSATTNKFCIARCFSTLPRNHSSSSSTFAATCPRENTGARSHQRESPARAPKACAPIRLLLHPCSQHAP